MKKAEKGGTRPAHRASAKNRTSVTILSKEAWDAGQAVVFPHSLKLEARAERTLSKASGLSISDRPTAGAIAGGELAEGAGFFPFSLFVGAMATGGGTSQVGLEAETEAQGRKGNRKHAGSKERITVYSFVAA